ncbi:hypothetical protein AURANDRAFT_63979 [Aureococcus anophagefferens]|uniref:Uncharacterized protein n=1 Tax=Aureococcus anophagefferens TaxID=44056 RepID=F0Y8G4_AURAN|nr:hypothetical protein AURANDRAFT_63979 [Aureococcus anophagefferens]EGB08600.1 hypothetical protein AURANDRAFT_63979 [Aureococcus anophagefferens]|eukprot:XP_009036601.1 hypothetical protein AURANDRAFT_63979 [Aureococcus anophagefferens]
MGGAGSVARPPAPAAWGAGGDVLCVELRAATGFPAAPPAGGGLPFVALRVGASDDAPVAARWPHARRAETAPVWRGWRPLGEPEGCAAITVELFEGGARATLDLVGADGAVAPGDVTASVGGCALVFAARVATCVQIIQ